jgi:hypothetical protein
MKEMKTLGYDWEFGHEELALRVGSYANNGCLYIGLYNKTEDGFDDFADLTVNLPISSMIPPEPNEAFISNFATESKIQFIKKHKLGVVLPEVGHSGYCTYAKVAFDLERLKEFDPTGVEEHLNQQEQEQQPIEEKKPKKKNKDQRER